jgi:hypothetical protein
MSGTTKKEEKRRRRKRKRRKRRRRRGRRMGRGRRRRRREKNVFDHFWWPRSWMKLAFYNTKQLWPHPLRAQMFLRVHFLA